jgi:hypothetical protein
VKILFKGLFGSHLYGLNTENSDRDYKAVYLPEPEDIILGRAKGSISHSTGGSDSKNSSEDVDTEYFSLQEFVKLACQGQTVAIDMLHTPPSLTLETSEIWEHLVSHRQLFYSKNMDSFMGYVKKQAAKYGIKGSKVAALQEILDVIEEEMDTNGDIPDISYLRHSLPVNEYCFWVDEENNGQSFYSVNGSWMHDVISVGELQSRVQKQYDNYGHRAKQAANNEGIDWKAISHALRAGYQLYHIFVEGDFEYPLIETYYLKQVKAGELDYTTNVAEELELLVEMLDAKSAEAPFPEKVDFQYWDEWVYSVYLQHILLEEGLL